jgi:hypothetical protein
MPGNSSNLTLGSGNLIVEIATLMIEESTFQIKMLNYFNYKNK